MKNEDIGSFCPSDRKQWREWLRKNHRKTHSVWLIYYKKNSGVPTISWSEAVDEALCFGWVDSKKMPIDEKKYMQFFSRRKKYSTWSKVNKEKINRLSEANLITKAGLDIIKAAKQNGSWTILDKIELLIIPPDLKNAFKSVPGSKEFFLSLSRSDKRNILQWLVLARQKETRQRRINEIIEQATQRQKPSQFR